MKPIKYLVAAIIAALVMGVSWYDPDDANATAYCLIYSGTGTCLHWGDQNRSSEQNIPLKIYGNYSGAIGGDSSTFATAFGNTGCGPGGGVMNILCGEVTGGNLSVTSGSYTAGSCPIGQPSSRAWTGLRQSTWCIDSYQESCGGLAADLWTGCAQGVASYEYQNGTWVLTAHLVEYGTFLDTTAYLANAGPPVTPNYSYPYYYKIATKKELVCHEAGHNYGADHPTNEVSCLTAGLCDDGNPNASDQWCTHALYSAVANNINSVHNHNDPYQPNYALLSDPALRMIKTRIDPLALKQATNPSAYYGKKGVKIVFGKPQGLPKRNVLYVALAETAFTPTATIKPLAPFAPATWADGHQ